MNPNNSESDQDQPTAQPEYSAQPPSTETQPTPPENVTSSSPESSPIVSISSTPAPQIVEPSVSSSPLKSLFLKVLIGCLLSSAIVAVIAILAGGLGDVGGKALWTILIVGLHALLALGFINMDGARNETGDLKVFTNVVFGIIILSFITATLGTWGVIPGDVALRMYGCFGVLLIAVLHGEVLARMLNHQTSTNNTVYTNFIFMSLVVVMLWVWILTPTLVESMNPFFLRLLAASAIVDGTLTLTAIILDRLYLSKHPQLITQDSIVTPSRGNGPSIIVIVVIALLGIQMVPALLFAFL